MEVGTVFRIDHPILEDGFRLSVAKLEDYPLYGVIVRRRTETNFRSVVYTYRGGGWLPFYWNWRLRHIETFTEVPL